MNKEKVLDVIIAGGGPAGLTAGLYAARARSNCLLLEKGAPGGQVLLTEKIENYPGFPAGGIGGFELTQKIQQQAKDFGLKIELGEITNISRADGVITVTAGEKSFKTYSLIIATGAESKRLNVPGEAKLLGRGVSFCGTCDGPFFKNKVVAVVGGGDTAVEEALFLTRFASQVHLIHRRDRLRATKILQERALANPRIKFEWNSVVQDILGEKNVQGVKLQDVNSGQSRELVCNGVFIFIGLVPNTIFLQDIVSLDAKGYVLADSWMKTSVPGIYACGDVRQKLLQQVVTACGDGATAAEAARLYVDELKGIAYK